LSAQTASLATYVAQLRTTFIVEREDYVDFTTDDHSRALAYRILASASLEGHVEEVCKAAAARAIDRARKSQPSRTAHALITWYAVGKAGATIPLSYAECGQYYPDLEAVQAKYERFVDKSHGLADRDLRNLVQPLGMAATEIDIQLLDLLKQLADARNPASHRRLNRARQMREPKAECEVVEGLLPLLEVLEQQLDGLVVSP
jgi:hypothetical protein